MSDNSETHGSMVAREIITLHDPFTMHSNGKAWFVHPPLSYWMQAVTGQLLGWTDFSMRLCEGLFGIFGLIVTFMIGRLFFKKSTAVAGSIILGTSLYYFIIARMAVFETILNTFILLEIYFFFKAYLNPGKKGRYFLGYAIAAALAVLSKGPIGLVQPGMIIVPFLLIKKDLAFLWDKRIGLNFLLFVVLVGPWYGYELHLHGIEFFNVALKDYTWFRFFGVVENQPGPWYYYVPVLLLFFPWIFHLPSTIKASLSSVRRNDNFFVFAWLFIGISFVFFSVAGTKQPNYIFSIFPFLSLLIAYGLFEAPPKRWAGWEALTTVLFSLLVTLLVAKTSLPAAYEADRPLLVWFFGIPFLTASCALLGYYFQKAKGLVTIQVIGTLVWLIFLICLFFPAVDKYKDSKTFVMAIQAQHLSNCTVINYQGYSPFLMYYLDRVVKQTDSVEEVQRWTEQSGVYYLVTPKTFDTKTLPKKLEPVASGYERSLYKITIP